jgi:carboxyl-terminal processing protease
VTINQFAEALAEARADNMESLIIDLRSNPGGSLKAAVEIGNMLLPAGNVVYTEDKYGNRTEYTSDGKHELDVPLVVLINKNSASASEILAGAIKDYKKGTLMGTTTFGKGIVQQLFSLSDGSAVKLTVSHYYTPNGNDIHKVGIKPDVEVKFDSEAYLKDGSDNQLDAAIEYLSK